MIEIQELSDNIMDEIHDAKKYAKLALKYKTKRPELAKLYYKLSLEESGHKGELHDAVAKLITEYQEKQGDPPPVMQAKYDYIHEMEIKKASKAHYLQAMYEN